MPTSESYLIEANREQTVSESDGFTEDRYGQFARHLSGSAPRILDVGCGTGRGGAVLKTRFPDASLIALDCVPERIAAVPRDIYAEAVCAFSTSLPLSDRSLDAVVAGEFLEHVPPEQIEATLCEFFRVLKLRGKLLLTTPNPGYLKNRIKGLSVMLDPCHVTQHHPDSLRRRLRDVGFASVRIEGSGRVSRILGVNFPLPLYGSYLASGLKW